MQSRALELLVGFFVCLGVAAIFILTLRVSDVSVGAAEGYPLTASFFNVGSLEVGAPVKMGGVRIGRVADIHLDPQTYQAVVTMHIMEQYQLPKGSGASIFTTGLLGSQYIGISPGGSLEYMQPGSSFVVTQGAIILEKLISQLLFSFAGGSGDSGGGNGGSNGGDSASTGAKPLFEPK